MCAKNLFLFLHHYHLLLFNHLVLVLVLALVLFLVLLLLLLFIIIIIIIILYIFFFSPASTKPAGLKIVKLDILLPNKISHCGGKNYVSEKLLLNATALPRWSDTESLW